ncbi:MAG: hypothetical protein IKB07_09370 [Lachnospiraceae bacterium]|nr:hypothetical protein [Lachnospiraceae bacterium]
MKTMESMLKKELLQLKGYVVKAKKRLDKAPKGNLRVRNWNGVVEYYYRNTENGSDNENRDNGRYLRKNEIDLASRLAQRDYDMSVIKTAEERIKAIERFLESYDRTSLKKLYQKTNPHRKALINSPVLSDEEFIKQWQAVEYKGKTFEDDENIIMTEKGERVRSKSEKIIADKLYAMGIPYRYEYPLVLESGVKMYPDFTILKMPMREEVYLEHFGMMDDMNYVDTALFKLNTYEKNEIYLGVNLFVTYETGRKALNTKSLDGLIRKLFCGE